MTKLHIIDLPNGKFGYTGAVPMDLAYITDDPELFKAVKQCGPGFAAGIAKKEGKIFKSRTFDTAKEAQEFAAENGHEANIAQPSCAANWLPLMALRKTASFVGAERADMPGSRPKRKGKNYV